MGAKKAFMRAIMGAMRGRDPLICTNDGSQFIFGKAERLFAEDMLPFPECSENLIRVQMVTSGDDHRVDRGIVDDSSGFGGAITETKRAGGMLGVGSGYSANAAETGI